MTDMDIKFTPIKSKIVPINNDAHIQRKHHQEEREKFCEDVKAFIGAGMLFLGLFALTVVGTIL